MLIRQNITYILFFLFIFLQIGGVFGQTPQKFRPGPQNPNDSTKQKKIQILNTDILTFERREGEPIQKLIGNVRILQDSTYFYCDSAYNYENINRLEAFGNVRIVMSDSVELLSDRLDYDGNERIANVYDNITLTDRKVILTTDRLIYYRNQSYGKYIEGGQLLNEQDTLRSITGHYYSDRKMAYFREKVFLNSPDYTLTTDTLGYNTEMKVAYFMSPTSIISEDGEILATRGEYDSENRNIELFERSTVKDTTYILTGDSLYYDDSTNFGRAIGDIFIQQEDSTLEIRGQIGTFKRDVDESVVTKEAVAIQYMEDDTLYMFADTLYSRQDSLGNRIFKAYYNVSFFMNEMQGKADSMVYFFSDSMMILYRDPILWSDVNQMTGDTVFIWMKNSQADSMRVSKSGFLVSQEDTVGFNQIKGKEIRAKFKDNQLSRLHVIGNSESIYYNKNDDGGYEGMNKCLSQEMLISFKDNEVVKIRFDANPEGTYHPIFEILFQENKLDGMQWRITEKPEHPLDPDTGEINIPVSPVRSPPPPPPKPESEEGESSEVEDQEAGDKELSKETLNKPPDKGEN